MQILVTSNIIGSVVYERETLLVRIRERQMPVRLDFVFWCVCIGIIGAWNLTLVAVLTSQLICTVTCQQHYHFLSVAYTLVKFAMFTSMQI